LELVLATGVVVLSIKKPLLRDPAAGVADFTKRTFSLGKSQLAFWSILIVGGYLYLFFATGQFFTILNNTAFILLGVSAGTSALAAAADGPTPGAAAAAVPPASQGFLADILSDGNGINVHRLQMLIWTLVFGLVFAYETVRTGAFPDFSDKYFGLMGLSSGTYVWMKRTEV
jgi:hypothetical protein